MAGWVAGCGWVFRGWVSPWLGGCVATGLWVGGWVAGWVAGWLAGWVADLWVATVAGWLSGWVLSYVMSIFIMAYLSCIISQIHVTCSRLIILFG